MKKIQFIIIAIIIIIIVAGVCFKLGLNVGKKTLEQTVAQYKKIIDYYMPTPKEMFSISGKITEIKDNAVNVETTVQNPYALPSEWKTEIIKVIITDKTTINKFDMDAGTKIEISLSDLKVGDQINAGAEENIKDKSEFTASSIELFIAPETPEILEPEL